MLSAALACALAFGSVVLAESIPVRHIEGVVHGFLILSSLDGTRLADGDLTQTARGDQVTTRMVFHFKDGSLRDETTVFSQRKNFLLISNHLIEKGPAFPEPIDVTLVRSAGRVTVRYRDDGEAKVEEERLELPLDVANGMLPMLLKNFEPGAEPTKVSMVAATPDPRLVKLAISRVGEDPLVIGRSTRKASHYVVKVEIGGIAGLLAPLLGKQPPDSHIWILRGEVPAFVKSESPLYVGGPMVRIELTSPVWPSTGVK